MKSSLVPLVIALLAISATAEERLAGITCQQDEYLTEASWNLPIVDVQCLPCNATINVALHEHAKAALCVRALTPTRSCAETHPGEHPASSVFLHCTVTAQTGALASIQCLLSEQNSSNGSRIQARSLLFLIDPQRQSATRVLAEECFTSAGVQRVRKTLGLILRNQSVREGSIESLTSQMIRNATIVPTGIRFLAYDSHHDLHETSLALAALREWLTPAVAARCRELE